MFVTTIVIANPARTFLESVLEGHPDVSDLHVVRSRNALEGLVADAVQVPDLVIIGLVLERTTPIRHVDDLYVQQDALRFVREALEKQPAARFVVCSAYWHVRLVTKSYGEGARWFVRDHAQITEKVIDGLVRVAADERLEPYGMDVAMSNQWIASHDEHFATFTNRDLEVVEALLVDPRYNDELVARLDLANLPGVYNRVSTLAKRGGFTNKEAMIAHAISVGIEPVDRLQAEPERLFDRSFGRLRPMLEPARSGSLR